MSDVTTANVWVNVEPPPVVEHPFGLFSVAPPRQPEGGDEWQLGVQWRNSPGCTDVHHTLDPCISGTTVVAKQPESCQELRAFKPFTVYTYLHRSGLSADVARAEADAAFAAAEQRGVESFVWNNQLPGLVTDHWTMGADAVGQALGLVELALAQHYNGTGVIHMDRGTATALGIHHLRVQGSTLVTTVGTPVVVGAGYGPAVVLSGGPAAPPPSLTGSIFGTGALVIRRGTSEVLEGFDRAVNDALVIAERTYVVGWDCVAVRADIPIGGT